MHHRHEMSVIAVLLRANKREEIHVLAHSHKTHIEFLAEWKCECVIESENVNRFTVKLKVLKSRGEECRDVATADDAPNKSCITSLRKRCLFRSGSDVQCWHLSTPRMQQIIRFAEIIPFKPRRVSLLVPSPHSPPVNLTLDNGYNARMIKYGISYIFSHSISLNWT